MWNDATIHSQILVNLVCTSLALELIEKKYVTYSSFQNLQLQVM